MAVTIKIHAKSHTDHGIPDFVREYVLQHFFDAKEFFAATIPIPESACLSTGASLNDAHNPVKSYMAKLPAIPCGLHLDVPESEAHYAKRGDREWNSRMCKRPPRMVREVTILAGPNPDDPDSGMILYTMYGGPQAPQEPGDPDLPDEKRAEAEAFWAKAALSQE